MRVFVRLHRQDGIAHVNSVIDPASVNAALSSVVCFVVDKAFEYIVDGLTDYGLTTLQFAV